MSLEAPVRENTMTSKLTAKILFCLCSTMPEESFAKEKVGSFIFFAGTFLSNIRMLGNTTKEIRKEKTIPVDIIQPRLIMGCMCEKSRDVNPAMVVMMAKKVGVTLESMVSRMVRFLEALGYLLKSSSYLTMRCKTMEMVMMSCKAIKLEEITVISQFQYPSAEVMAVTESVQMSIGSSTHLAFLNATPSTMISRSIRIEP